MAERPEGARRMRPCPICGKPATAGEAPFCSPRCADVDLHRWMAGRYALPATPSDEEDAALPTERDDR